MNGANKRVLCATRSVYSYKYVMSGDGRICS